MDLQQLRTLIAIATERNVSRAAKRLHLTQPALSMQIRRLEDELGELLLDRSGKQIGLTAAGELLLARSRRIFEEIAEAEREIESLRGLHRGSVAVGCSDTATRYYLAARIAEFLDRYPGIELNLLNRTTPEIVEQVLERRIDLGFVLLPVHDDRLDVRRLFEYREIAICSNHHALAQRKRVTLDALVPFPLLLLEARTRSRTLLDVALAQRGIAPQRVIEVGSVDLQKELARIGLGVAIVPDYAASGTELVRLQVPELPRRALGVIRRSDRPVPAPARALLELLP